MKSLDFIIKQIGILQDGITTEEFKIEQKSGSEATIVFLQELIKEYKQVKQDLEVLKILKNKSVNIPKLKLVADVFSTIEEKEILKRYNNNFASGTENKLTFDQYQKIKEWLEE